VTNDTTTESVRPATARTVDADAVVSVLHRAEREHQFAGVVHVARGGETLASAAVGVASRRWDVPVTAGTRFDVASVTKLFTAVAVLQQVDAGALALDDRITEVVDLTGTTISPDVTIRHLLTHTSGLADDADEEAGESYEALWQDRPSYTVTTTADLLPQFVHKPARVAPGTDCRYCNVGYVLAGLALEKVTGSSYRDHVREHVLARAGMNDSGFFHMADAVPDVAERWDPVRDDAEVVTGWRQNVYSYPPVGSPDGGAHCTAADLVRFMDAVRAGELLSPELTAAYLTPQVLHDVDEHREIHYGFGLEFTVRPDGSVRCYDKDGVNVGASAVLRHDPEADVTVALLSNSSEGAWEPFSEIDALVANWP